MTDKNNSGGFQPSYYVSGIFIITIAYLILISSVPDWLIGTPEYKQPVIYHGETGRIPAAFFITLITLAAGIFIFKDTSNILSAKYGQLKIYLILLLLGIALQLGPSAVHRMGFLEYPLKVYVPDHTSYFTDALTIKDLDRWLEEFPAKLPLMHTHTRTHPPGAVVLFYAGQKTMEKLPWISSFYVDNVPRSDEAMRTFGLTPSQTAAGGLCAFVLFIITVLVVPLTFAIARIFTDDETSVLAALFFASVPAFAHRTPVLDHMLALILLISLWFVLSSIRHKQIWKAPLAGLLMGAGTWFGTTLFAALPLCLLFCAAAVWHFRQNGAPAKNLVIIFFSYSGILVGTAVTACFFSGLFFGLDFIDVYTAITKHGWEFNNTTSGRVSSWMWILYNPHEFLMWAGIPLSIIFISAIFKSVRDVLREGMSKLDPWLAAFMIFLVALDLSGKVCYESSRLVWFGYPLLAIFSAGYVIKLFESDKHKYTYIFLILLLLAANAFVLRMIL